MAPISRMLVANRGEIAVRILTTARELGIYTLAIYTSEDSNHAVYADEGILLAHSSDFTNISRIVNVAKTNKVDAIHPGYGFLSESPEFADTLQHAGIQFIGPSSTVLRQTSDKTDARRLAEQSGVPTLPATANAVRGFDEAAAFVSKVGLPVMIKAVDGGGGRGIRLVREMHELQASFDRACGESPSGSVFIEKAAVDGFRHVEVQILGDSYGNVGHLWERECSIQRRFQKMVEIAPSTIRDQDLISRVIDAAVTMAKGIGYSSLATFEFLVHDSKAEYFFLEVNPRLQVEHTITEEISGVDIVRSQILLAQGATIDSLDLPTRIQTTTRPRSVAIQLRVTAEDAEKNFVLSIGRVVQFQPPVGVGVRVDTHLSTTKPTIVGSSFDSLLAKIIVRAPDLTAAVTKSLRALSDTTVKGVKTNIDVLAGIVSHADFAAARCSTRWLEDNINEVIENGKALTNGKSLCLREPYITSDVSDDTSGRAASLGNAHLLFRKGDSFKLELRRYDGSGKASAPEEHILRLDRVLTNNFPLQLQVDTTFQSYGNTVSFGINLTATTQTSVASSRHWQADPSDPSQVGLPFPGQFVEMYVELGDQVAQNELLCVVKQMKMELEVRAPREGVVSWVCEAEEGEQVNEGILLCQFEPVTSQNRTSKL